VQNTDIKQFGTDGNKIEAVFPRIRVCVPGYKANKESERTGNFILKLDWGFFVPKRIL
jgi:hypothetical protein